MNCGMSDGGPIRPAGSVAVGPVLGGSQGWGVMGQIRAPAGQEALVCIRRRHAITAAFSPPLVNKAARFRPARSGRRVMADGDYAFHALPFVWKTISF